jgi:protein phosphatase
MSDQEQQDTQELYVEGYAARRSNRSFTTKDVAAKSHVGLVRASNQDHYLVIRFGRSLQSLHSNVDQRFLPGNYDLIGHAFLVADGLGGMSGGAVASRTALTKLIDLVIETPDWILGFRDHERVETILARARERFLKIDEDLKDRGDYDATLSGMSTTLTMVVTLGREAIVGHLGDSRAYLFRDAVLSQLTKDHTVAQELIDAGRSSQDPVTRSMRHVLTAALGSLGTRIQPEVQRLRLEENDQILLCTDGLTEMVDDQVITSVLGNAQSAARACEDLTTAAIAAGGLDNVTVVLAHFGSS